MLTTLLVKEWVLITWFYCVLVLKSWARMELTSCWDSADARLLRHIWHELILGLLWWVHLQTFLATRGNKGARNDIVLVKSRHNLLLTLAANFRCKAWACVLKRHLVVVAHLECSLFLGGNPVKGRVNHGLALTKCFFVALWWLLSTQHLLHQSLIVSPLLLAFAADRG